jgi:hypothetical protein
MLSLFAVALNGMPLTCNERRVNFSQVYRPIFKIALGRFSNQSLALDSATLFILDIG